MPARTQKKKKKFLLDSSKLFILVVFYFIILLLSLMLNLFLILEIDVNWHWSVLGFLEAVLLWILYDHYECFRSLELDKFEF